MCFKNCYLKKNVCIYKTAQHSEWGMVNFLKKSSDFKNCEHAPIKRRIFSKWKSDQKNEQLIFLALVY